MILPHFNEPMVSRSSTALTSLRPCPGPPVVRLHTHERVYHLALYNNFM